MRPGSSTEPIWRTRIKTEWNSSVDALDVWVILEEYDTDKSWIGMRVLDQNGHWREWITSEGVSLGLPTQSLPAIQLARTPPLWASSLAPPSATIGAPITPKLTPAALDSMKQALEGSPLVVSPAVREWMTEREFVFGKGVTTDE